MAEARCIWTLCEGDEEWTVSCAPDQPLGIGEVMAAEHFTYCLFCGREIEWSKQEPDDGE